MFTIRKAACVVGEGENVGSENSDSFTSSSFKGALEPWISICKLSGYLSYSINITGVVKLKGNNG